MNGQGGAQDQGSQIALQAARVNRYLVRYPGWEKFLLFLSKTDTYALQFCTDETRRIQTSIGATVFVTGIMAFISSFFTLETTFLRANESVFAHIVVPVIALFYAVAIMLFDREVVSATTKWAAVLRIPFAILIGLVISYPIEMRLMQDRIDAQLTAMTEQRNADKVAAIDDFHRRYNETIAKEQDIVTQELQRELDQAKKYQDSLEEVLKGIHQQWEAECNRGFCGPKAKKLEELGALTQDKLKLAIDEYKEKQKQFSEKEKIFDNIRNAVDARLADEKKKIDKLQKEIDQEKKAHDILSQFESLEQIKRNNPVTRWLSFVIMSFFVLFELFPVAIKAFLPYTDYLAYLDSRRRITANKIISVANEYDVRFKEALQKAFTDPQCDLRKLHEVLPPELTDILEEIMEDRMSDFQASPRAGGGARHV